MATAGTAVEYVIRAQTAGAHGAAVVGKTAVTVTAAVVTAAMAPRAALWD